MTYDCIPKRKRARFKKDSRDADNTLGLGLGSGGVLTWNSEALVSIPQNAEIKIKQNKTQRIGSYRGRMRQFGQSSGVGF